MDEIKITNYSLVALLILTFTAFVYTCNIVNANNHYSESGSKVVAGFKA